MSVRGQREDVARLLRRELGADDVVVSAPDHPLLIEGPDVVVGGKGGLLAVYMPKAKERRRPDHLKVRFILNRLAFPPEIRHVLVLKVPIDDAIAERLASNFAETIRWQDRRELATIARDREFTGGQRKLPPEVIAFARHRFSDVYQVARVLQDVTRRHQPPGFAEHVRSDSGPRRRAPRKPVERIAPGILYTSFGQGVPATPSLSSLAEQTTSSGFMLDNSIPYPTGEDDHGLAIVDELPSFRGDPEKPMRAAAFAGWALVPDEQRHAVSGIVERLGKRRAMRRSQWP